MAKEVTRRCRGCGRAVHQHISPSGKVYWFSDDHGYVSYCPSASGGPVGGIGLHEPDKTLYPLPPPGTLIEELIWERAVDDAENKLRIRNRAIADAHAQELLEHHGHQAVMGQWHNGTCKTCGLEDLVIGVPGSEYCRYCEELRTLTPPPEMEAQLRPPPPARKTIHPVRLLIGMVALFTGLSLAASAIFQVPAGMLLILGLLTIIL